jgi:glycosyltransferase involved in cell wall biosynthesis
VVMPSIWWENAPLVVLEAFRHGRPVICGNVGGMAEMVRDGVDGLHAPMGDPAGFAQVMRRAIETEGLWERLAAGIRPPPTIARIADQHFSLYQDVLEQTSPVPTGADGVIGSPRQQARPPAARSHARRAV